MSEIGSDFVNAIEQLSRRAMTPEVFEKDDVRYISYNGDLVNHPIAPEHRSHDLRSVEAVIEFAKAHDESMTYVGRDSLCVVCNDDDRRDYAMLRYGFAPQLAAVENAERFGQDEAVRFFFHELRECCPADTHNLFRAISFSTTEQGESVRRRDRESMGKEILASVKAGADELPEVIHVEIPRGTLVDFDPRYVARLTVDVNHQQRYFLIELHPSDGNQIRNWFARDLLVHLKGAGVDCIAAEIGD